MIKDTVISIPVKTTSAGLSNGSAESSSDNGFARYLSKRSSDHSKMPAIGGDSNWTTKLVGEHIAKTDVPSPETNRQLNLKSTGYDALRKPKTFGRDGNEAAGIDVGESPKPPIELRFDTSPGPATETKIDHRTQMVFDHSSPLEKLLVVEHLERPLTQETQQLYVLDTMRMEVSVSELNLGPNELVVGGADSDTTIRNDAIVVTAPILSLLDLNVQLPIDEDSSAVIRHASQINEIAAGEVPGANSLDVIAEAVMASQTTADIMNPVRDAADYLQTKLQELEKIELQNDQRTSTNIDIKTIRADLRLSTDRPEIGPVFQKSQIIAAEHQSIASALKGNSDVEVNSKSEQPVSIDEVQNLTRIFIEKNKKPAELNVAERTLGVNLGKYSQTVLTLSEAIRNNTNWSKSISSSSVQTNQLVTNGGGTLQSMRVQLNPIELGKVDLNFRMQGGKLQIEVRVETDQALRALSVDQDILVNSIRGLGYKVDSIVINGPNSDSGSQNQSFPQPGDQRFQGEKNERRTSGKNDDLKEFGKNPSQEDSAGQNAYSGRNNIEYSI